MSKLVHIERRSKYFQKTQKNESFITKVLPLVFGKIKEAAF